MMMETEERMDMPQEEVTVNDLEENLAQPAQMQREADDADEAQEQIEAIRQGLAELFEDGWTTAELEAFTQDEAVRSDIAAGHGVVRTACAYLKRNDGQAAWPARRRGVPVTRATAAGTAPRENRIEHMTDAQFDAFSKRAREAVMEGKRVRL